MNYLDRVQHLSQGAIEEPVSSTGAGPGRLTLNHTSASWQDLGFGWCWAEGLSSFFGCCLWGCLKGSSQHGSCLPSEQAHKRARGGERGRRQSQVNFISEVRSPSFYLFICIETSVNTLLFSPSKYMIKESPDGAEG